MLNLCAADFGKGIGTGRWAEIERGAMTEAGARLKLSWIQELRLARPLDGESCLDCD